MSKTLSAFTIRLHDLHFFAFHGLYEEEKIVGNEFEVNISMKVKANGEKISIQDTINYAGVYEVVKEIFSHREDLLETICISCSQAIKQKFPQLKKISVQIIKLRPPIASFTGSVSVTYKKSFKND